MRISSRSIDSYPVTIRPLLAGEGTGFLIEYPDLPGCISDGTTPEGAIINGRDAVKTYLQGCAKFGDPIPKPNTTSSSGQWRQRVPRSIHARLVAQARREGVSLNTLVATFIAEGLGRKAAAEEPAKRKAS